MNNFLDFIEQDVSAKKELVSSLPLSTKTDKKKYNAKLEEIINKYNEYKKVIVNYILNRAKTFELKECNNSKDALRNSIKELEDAMLYLNTFNNTFEKCGFGDLVYKIENYGDFNFNTLNEIINDFLDKFSLAGIELTSEDFKLSTCYVYQYMYSFLKIRAEKINTYDSLSELFEKIYWCNPEIIAHIGLNFRILIFNNMDKFDAYIKVKQQEIMNKLNVTNYEECRNKLKNLYIELSKNDIETINDIVELAKEGTIDINNYLPASKVKSDIFNSFISKPTEEMNEEEKAKIYSEFMKLRINIEEYVGYAKMIPIINYFRDEYKDLLAKGNNTDQKESKKGLFGFLNKKEKASVEVNHINDDITIKEKELAKINKQIFENKENRELINKLKADSLIMVNELSNLYNDLYGQYIKDNISRYLNQDATVDDVLKTYYNFDYLKDKALKKIYNGDISYDEIVKKSNIINSFAINPTHLIVRNISFLSDNEVNTIIINHYKINGINVTFEDLNLDTLEEFLNKIDYVLRIHIIEKSPIDEEKIWFIVQANKIDKKETVKASN